MKPVSLVVAIVVCALPLAGCSASGKAAGFEDDAGTPGLVTGSSGSLGPADGGTGPTAPSGAPLLYAHTDTTLFQLDPANIGGPMTTVGDFDCIGTGKAAKSMTDLAVAKDGKLYGVSEGAAFPLTVQGTTVHCDATWTLPATKFYGLTVAPENTVAAGEVLIAAAGSGGGLYQIDPASGTPTQVGTLGVDPKTKTAWELSGDIVFLANGGNPVGFATVRSCNSKNVCSTIDTLIEVDVTAIKAGTQSVLKSVRGPVSRGAWCTNAASPASFGGMFGIVAYKDVVYGFSRQGDIVEIHNTDGSGCLVSSDLTHKFAGAGITTSAPVIAPPVN
jgi:hypothetical protein